MAHKITLAILALTISACTSTPQQDARTPYEMEPVTVTVHIVAQEDWFGLAAKYEYFPWDVNGIARWEKDEYGVITECHIYFHEDRPPSKYTFSHEIRHCNEGAFH